jgi:acetyl esterase/lipase
MKTLLASAILLSSLILSRAEIKNAIPLWPDGAPGALGTKSNDIPTLTPYLPDATPQSGTTGLTRQSNATPRQRAVWNTATRGTTGLKRQSNATGAALVICPGGAYTHLAPHEGNDYALWLNQHGVTCFVLKYRLGSSGYRHPAEFEDVTRAMRWVRAHADDYRIDPHRIGIMGSSAGGHLASTLMTHFDSGDTNSPDPIERQSSRPDIGILCYPVITMGEFTHKGSHDMLLGTNPPPELVKLLSNELQVTTNTPPCFIWQTFEDKTVPVENSMLFAEALRKNHVPFDLHIYQKGGHGMGLGDRKPPFAHPHPWAADCLFWLKQQGWVK